MAADAAAAAAVERDDARGVVVSAGQRVDTGKARVSGSQMSVSLRGGGAGIYRVNWRVLSVDAHRTEGNFTFRVGR